MNTLIQQGISKLSFYSALIVTIVTSVVRANMCGQNTLIQCAENLHKLDTGLTFVAKNELDSICPDLKESLRCIHRYTRHCMSLEHREHFNKLFNGTTHMVRKLCSDGDYTKEYLKHAPCMAKAEPKSQTCLEHHQRTMGEVLHRQRDAEKLSEQERRILEEDGVKSVCCIFHEYVDCTVGITRETCGNEAAQFTKGFLDSMAFSMVRHHCEAYVSETYNWCNAYSHSSPSASASNWLATLIPLILTALWVR